MARPIKQGLEYFPLDVDMDQDDKITLIEAQHGLIGFGIAIKLLMKIYNNSYFYEWTEKEQLLFSKRVNVDINEVNVVINDLIKWGFFDKKLFKVEKILTSKGIQVRYLMASNRRQTVKILKEYLLLDTETVNAYKNLVIVDNNINSKIVNVDSGTQSKVKESKVNKTKGKEKETETPLNFPPSFPTPLHEKIFNQFGDVTYKTWFKDLEVIEADEEIIINFTDKFKKQIVEDKYIDSVKMLTGKTISTELKNGDE